MQLFVRNRVEDYDIWYKLFVEGVERGAQYGLKLAHLWQAHDEPNNVFFVLDVESIEQTDAFMASSESEETGKQAGIVDSEYYYLIER